MEKEEILKKSRESRIDEGLEHVENEGRKAGYIIFTLLFVFLITFNFFYGESVTFHALISLLWAYIAAEAYVKYRFTRSKIVLTTVIAGSLASILSVVNYIVAVLK